MVQVNGRLLIESKRHVIVVWQPPRLHLGDRRLEVASARMLTTEFLKLPYGLYREFSYRRSPLISSGAIQVSCLGCTYCRPTISEVHDGLVRATLTPGEFMRAIRVQVIGLRLTNQPA